MLLEGLTSADAELARQHPLLGLARLHHRNTRGKPMRFADKPFLVEVYRDLPRLPEVRVQKAVQVGVSELLIQHALHRAGWEGGIVAYVLPTSQKRDQVVQLRINPILLTVPAYRERMPRAAAEAGNLKRKLFGGGTLLFLGSNTDADFLEFSADCMIIDEHDECEPSNVAKAFDRIRESPRRQMVYIGNPTLPRVGIARLYDGSDGRRWHSRCARCKEWQPLVWDQNVVERDDAGDWVPRDRERARDAIAGRGRDQRALPGAPDIRPVCRRCRRPFERQALGGAWVAERTDVARVRGWHMSRLDVLSERLAGFHEEWVKAQGLTRKVSTFHTSVLGEPWEAAGAALVFSELETAARGPELDYAPRLEDYRARRVTAGIDVGAVLNVHVSVIEPGPTEDAPPVRRAAFVGAFRTFDEVVDCLIRYSVDTAVFDADPETHKVKEVRELLEARGDCQVWLCRFHPTAVVGDQVYGWKLDWPQHRVQVDRTQVFDTCTDDIRSGRRVFPGDVATVLGWSEQMQAPKRVLDEERQRIVWTEGSDPDHYRLSDVYDRVAYDLMQQGGGYFSVG